MIFIFFLSFQEIEKVADTFYSLREYDMAVLEYKRAVYLAPSPFLKIKLASALYQNKEKKEANEILSSMETPLARMVRGILLLREGSFHLALITIDSVTKKVFGAYAYRLRGWAYLKLKEFERAAKEFEKAGEDSLALFISKLSSLKFKNPYTAWFLSLLPGLGEIYAGKPIWGLWAFLVNAGTTYLMLSNLLTKHYLDAFLIYTFLWQRFYSGSQANAFRFAKEYNENKFLKTVSQIQEKENKDLSLDLKSLNKLYEISRNYSW